ncbi:MAG: 4a-hydroxytetrahydrobiopterin dehydratase [Acidobacteriota bacterium]
MKGDEIDALTRELDGGWAVISEHHLEKEFRFPDFKSALAFTNAVGEVAEKKGHHPDIHLSWGRVKLEIFTHAVGGLTRSDFVLAAGIDQAT